MRQDLWKGMKGMDLLNDLIAGAKEAKIGAMDYAVLECGLCEGVELLMPANHVYSCITIIDLLKKMFPNLALSQKRGITEARFRRSSEAQVAILRGEACEYCRRPYDGKTKRCGGCAGSVDKLHKEESKEEPTVGKFNNRMQAHGVPAYLANHLDPELVKSLTPLNHSWGFVIRKPIHAELRVS